MFYLMNPVLGVVILNIPLITFIHIHYRKIKKNEFLFLNYIYYINMEGAKKYGKPSVYFMAIQIIWIVIFLISLRKG